MCKETLHRLLWQGGQILCLLALAGIFARALFINQARIDGHLFASTNLGCDALFRLFVSLLFFAFFTTFIDCLIHFIHKLYLL